MLGNACMGPKCSHALMLVQSSPFLTGLNRSLQAVIKGQRDPKPVLQQYPATTPQESSNCLRATLLCIPWYWFLTAVAAAATVTVTATASPSFSYEGACRPFQEGSFGSGRPAILTKYRVGQINTQWKGE